MERVRRRKLCRNMKHVKRYFAFCTIKKSIDDVINEEVDNTVKCSEAYDADKKKILRVPDIAYQPLTRQQNREVPVCGNYLKFADTLVDTNARCTNNDGLSHPYDDVIHWVHALSDLLTSAEVWDSSLDGQESASDLTGDTSISNRDIKTPKTAENMSKRSAAKELIAQYYCQLTEGCGNESCDNENCASSRLFRFKESDKNNLALQAIELSKIKASLCGRRPSKISRLPSEDEKECSSSAFVTTVESQCLGTGAKSKMPSPPAVSSVEENSFLSPSGSSTSLVKESHYLSEDKIASLIIECKSSNSWRNLIHQIGSVFNNPDCIIKSFRKNCMPSVHQEGDVALQNADTALLDSQCMTQAAGPKTDSDLTVDLPSLRRAFQQLLELPDHPFQGAFINALTGLSQTLELEIKYHSVLDRQPDYINIFIIVMEIPMLHFPEYLESAFPCVCKVIGMLPVITQARLARAWSTFEPCRLREMVQSLQQMITVKVINFEGRWSSTLKLSDDVSITNATRVLKILYYASMLGGKIDSCELVEEELKINEFDSIQDLMQGAFGLEPKETSPAKEDPLGKELGLKVINCREPLVPYEEFINEPLNDSIDIGLDYTNHRLEPENKFSFVPYSFILTTASKHTFMYYDNRIRMLQERRTAFVQTLVHGGPPNPFLRVRVRRDHIIDDALVNLEMIAMENPSDLRKQLFVEFDGEQGLDEGGVSKEFFQLIVEELFNPDIGMFTYNEDSHHFWFNSLSFENDAQFTLIGILLGLAIYNSCILDIHFPMVVYRKLMGKKGMFADLYDVDPILMSSLKAMLEYTEDSFEDVFDQTFRIGYHDVFGNSLTYDLKENGDSTPVTQENKQEFVDLYCDYLLNKSIDQQFRAFKRGFLMVTSESPLKQLFRPEEIELLVCGSRVLDFHALEEATEYDGGFTAESSTIRNFWKVVHDMVEDDKKKLLQFTTGTDRVPVGGLSKLKMIIARNGPDSDRLPTAHTCFNVLLLPEYPTVEKLRDRLLKAINYSKGFGML
ncbi:Ubiquitin-protein ligase E3A [Bulinus truncatus]|nr:Ubiquitin-protein ligase E3A [Bulinus truncatus]